MDSRKHLLIPIFILLIFRSTATEIAAALVPVYSTYFGGEGSEYVGSPYEPADADVAIDIAGNTYITGWTESL